MSNVNNPDGSSVRISNYIKIIDKEHVVIMIQEDLKIYNKRKWMGFERKYTRGEIIKNIQITKKRTE